MKKRNFKYISPHSYNLNSLQRRYLERQILSKIPGLQLWRIKLKTFGAPLLFRQQTESSRKQYIRSDVLFLRPLSRR